MKASSTQGHERTADRVFYGFTAIVSIGAVAFLAYLLLFRKASGGASELAFLPAQNACFNALSATLLTAGYRFIRLGRVRAHRACMVTAFLSSSLFLVGYVLYHYVHGDTRYGGSGAWKAAYLCILATHVLLSMLVVPGALLAFYFAARSSFARHRRVARVLLPVWLYVSVTGVVIFFMLHASLPAP